MASVTCPRAKQLLKPTAGRSQGPNTQELQVKPANRGQASGLKIDPTEDLSNLTKDKPRKVAAPREISRGMKSSKSYQLEIPDKCLTATDTIPFLADEICEGQEMVVLAPCVYSPSEIYLSSVADFPTVVDKHIWTMSDVYHKFVNSSVPFNLTAHPEALEEGMFVAVHDDHTTGEYYRGRIVKKEPNKCNTDRKFSIQHVDLGETMDYRWGQIFFLDEHFSRKPCFAIRCRFMLSYHYVRYHCGADEWSPLVQNKLLKLLLNRPMRVKFHRRVLQQGVKVWEVSIEGFETPYPLFPGKRPIQEEIIKHITGAYINNSGESC